MKPLTAYVETWNPSPTVHDDVLPTAPIAAMSALLDLPGPAVEAGDPLPPLWQWLYFLSWPRHSDLGVDGHPEHGDFLPPIPCRQRMFAGGRCETVEPLVVGEATRRRSEVTAVVPKSGATGELLFVTVRSVYTQQDRTCLVEEQDIVYRSGRASPQQAAGVPGDAAVPHPDAPWTLPFHPDPTMLFRFSALTANAHRIHYDAAYARNEEGHPGLVVHGPLLALMMAELVRNRAPFRKVRTLSFRLRRPCYSGEPLMVSGTATGDHARLRVATAREDQHATAQVTFE